MTMNEVSEYRKAKALELELAERYSREWKEPVFLVIGRFGEFDFCSHSKRHSIEIKLDDAAARTQNLAFEFWNLSLDEPSGILSTRANTWLHCIDQGGELCCLEFEIQLLRRKVIELGYPKSTTNALLKLIPLRDIRPFVRREFTIQGTR
jgi:hypothetical protein